MRFLSALALVGVTLVVAGTAQDRAPAGDDPTGKGGHAHSSAHMAKDRRAMSDRMVEHLGHKDAEYEKRFIDMMIPHHEGAIRSARHALEQANKPELKEMARKPIEDQEKEIAQLKKWRKEWYGDEK